MVDFYFFWIYILLPKQYKTLFGPNILRCIKILKKVIIAVLGHFLGNFNQANALFGAHSLSKLNHNRA